MGEREKSLREQEGQRAIEGTRVRFREIMKERERWREQDRQSKKKIAREQNRAGDRVKAKDGEHGCVACKRIESESEIAC